MKYFTFILIIFSSLSLASEEYQPIICNNCYAPESFRAAAIATGYQDTLVVLVNSATGGARAYLVAPPETIPEDFNYAKPKNLPADVQPTIDEYFAFQNALQNYIDLLETHNSGAGINKFEYEVLSSSANGCGSPDYFISYHLVVDFPFLRPVISMIYAIRVALARHSVIVNSSSTWIT